MVVIACLGPLRLVAIDVGLGPMEICPIARLRTFERDGGIIQQLLCLRKPSLAALSVRGNDAHQGRELLMPIFCQCCSALCEADSASVQRAHVAFSKAWFERAAAICQMFP